MPGRPRKIGLDKYHVDVLTMEEVHKLLVKELGAKLVPDSDNTVPQEWAPPKLTQKEMEEMGLFDSYKQAGVDLGNIELDPFKYDDGIYVMALAGFTFGAAKKQEWGNQLELRFMIVGDSNGEPNKYTGKSHTMWLSFPLPQSLKSDDDDIKAKANMSLQRSFQTLHAMGIPDPKEMELADLQKLQSTKFQIRLNTPMENNPNRRQYSNIFGPWEVANANSPRTEDV